MLAQARDRGQGRPRHGLDAERFDFKTSNLEEQAEQLPQGWTAASSAPDHDEVTQELAAYP
ncbi:hypothetical protein [Streptomyces lavendulocolor]|uniref:hypothetical protein n=1 Tax=Streptomyces lavendulocolor TaxID=67316 RepID=UPI003C3009D2